VNQQQGAGGFVSGVPSSQGLMPPMVPYQQQSSGYGYGMSAGYGGVAAFRAGVIQKIVVLEERIHSDLSEIEVLRRWVRSFDASMGQGMIHS